MTKEGQKQGVFLQIVGDYALSLDDSTGFMTTSLQYIHGGSNDNLLVFQYEKDNKILIYNAESKTLQNKIIFEKEGPNGVGSSLKGVLWVSHNEIYLYSYWERRVYKVNDKAKVLKMVQFDAENEMLPVLEPGTFRPMLKIGDDILLTGYLFKTFPKGKIGRPFLKVSQSNDNYLSLGEYPEKIYLGDWSIKAQTYFDFITKDSLFIISYAISDSVWVTDFKSRNDRYLASSDLISEIFPQSPDYDFKGEDKAKGYAYDLSSEYFGIKYDPYLKMYYRFGIIGRSLQEFSSGVMPSFFVIILDENMAKIGEHVFEKGEYPTMCFVTEKGLHVASKNKYLENENYLTFNIYYPKKQ